MRWLKSIHVYQRYSNTKSHDFYGSQCIILVYIAIVVLMVGYCRNEKWVLGCCNTPPRTIDWIWSALLQQLQNSDCGIFSKLFKYWLFDSYRAFADRRGYVIMSLSRITTWPTWSLQLPEINNIMYMQWKHSIMFFVPMHCHCGYSFFRNKLTPSDKAYL